MCVGFSIDTHDALLVLHSEIPHVTRGASIVWYASWLCDFEMLSELRDCSPGKANATSSLSDAKCASLADTRWNAFSAYHAPILRVEWRVLLDEASESRATPLPALNVMGLPLNITSKSLYIT